MIEIKIKKELLDNEFNYMEVLDTNTNVKATGDIIHLNIKGIILGLDVSHGTIRLFNDTNRGELKLIDSLSDTMEVILK